MWIIIFSNLELLEEEKFLEAKEGWKVFDMPQQTESSVRVQKYWYLNSPLL